MNKIFAMQYKIRYLTECMAFLLKKLISVPNQSQALAETKCNSLLKKES